MRKPKERDRVGQYPKQDPRREQDAIDRRTKAARIMASYDKASERGGSNGRRGSGAIQRRQGPVCIPDRFIAWSQGYRLPIEPETPQQAEAVNKLIVEYVRGRPIARYPDLSVETLASALNVSPTTARRLRGGRNYFDDLDAEFRLTCDVLIGMFNRTIAGPTALRSTADNAWLLSTMNNDEFLDPQHFTWPPIPRESTLDTWNLWNAFRLQYGMMKRSEQ